MGIRLIQLCRRGLSLRFFPGQWSLDDPGQSAHTFTCGF
jgi:hypothetical protein